MTLAQSAFIGIVFICVERKLNEEAPRSGATTLTIRRSSREIIPRKKHGNHGTLSLAVSRHFSLFFSLFLFRTRRREGGFDEIGDYGEQLAAPLAFVAI